MRILVFMGLLHRSATPAPQRLSLPPGGRCHNIWLFGTKCCDGRGMRAEMLEEGKLSGVISVDFNKSIPDSVLSDYLPNSSSDPAYAGPPSPRGKVWAGAYLKDRLKFEIPVGFFCVKLVFIAPMAR